MIEVYLPFYPGIEVSAGIEAAAYRWHLHLQNHISGIRHLILATQLRSDDDWPVFKVIASHRKHSDQPIVRDGIGDLTFSDAEIQGCSFVARLEGHAGAVDANALLREELSLLDQVIKDDGPINSVLHLYAYGMGGGDPFDRGRGTGENQLWVRERMGLTGRIE